MLQHQTLMRLSSAAAAAGSASHVSNSPATCAPAVVVEKRKRERRGDKERGKNKKRQERGGSPLHSGEGPRRPAHSRPFHPARACSQAQFRSRAMHGRITLGVIRADLDSST